MRELAQTLVQEMMAEKEAEIRLELTDRQAKIEELQRRLVESEKRAKQGELSLEEKRQREALQRQIAAEEEAREKREAELEAEKDAPYEQMTYYEHSDTSDETVDPYWRDLIDSDTSDDSVR